MYHANGHAVHAYLARRVGDPADVEDLVAEVWATAWRRFDAIPSNGGELPWLYVTARNHLANWRRKHRRTEPFSEDHAGVESTGSEEAHDVLRLLAGLSAADQEVLRLAAWEELSPTEMAQVLGITASAARVRLHRARRRLQRRLDRADRRRADR
ncbi:MAG: sigma-70 family RNA polymerase sigma factor [Actinobacteria bacterium]|nr:MAG: sigma-70 family RNA polymerase sigma factor [Actinomycetota bacterium]RIK06384.1 MAG: RNA polymerase subunit sigma-24 [Acidobacteriota bacterium]